MKIFNSIKKKWLQYRVYYYTLKSQDALSESKVQHNLSENYNTLAVSTTSHNIAADYYQKAAKCMEKSEHLKNLSNIYTNIKEDLKKELQDLTSRKAE